MIFQAKIRPKSRIKKLGKKRFEDLFFLWKNKISSITIKLKLNKEFINLLQSKILNQLKVFNISLFFQNETY